MAKIIEQTRDRTVVEFTKAETRSLEKIQDRDFDAFNFEIYRYAEDAGVPDRHDFANYFTESTKGNMRIWFVPYKKSEAYKEQQKRVSRARRWKKR